MEKNLYTPHIMRIEKIVEEAPGMKTFKLAFEDAEKAASFQFKAGQFGEYSIFGAGECTFCVASSPTRKGYIECTFQVAGKVTNALADSNEGDRIGFRGPYGNSFPIDDMKGKNIVFIGMGIGLAPVRSLIWNCLDLRDQFKKITILVGARNPDLLIYKDELAEWASRSDITFVKTVDNATGHADWNGKVGLGPAILREMAPSPDDTFAVLCGPPIAIKFTMPVLTELGFAEDQIYTTLENRMKCGVGKCGRCNIGNVYVCKDGPVFSLKQLMELPEEY